MKKLVYSLLVLATTLVACTEDFTDWAQPQKNDQPQTVSFGDGSVTTVGLIDFAELAEDQALVKVCDIKAPTSSDQSYNNKYFQLRFEDGTSSALNESGEMPADILKGEVETNFGVAPVERELTATVEQWISNGQTAIKSATSDPFVVKVKLNAPEIEEAYYITGSINDWDNTNTTYKLTNGGGDVYENPIFTVSIPAEVVGDGFEFKLTPESGLGGDWSKCIAAAEEEGKFNYNNNGGNLVVNAVEGAVTYKLTFNMLEGTWSYEGVSYLPFLYFIGATDGWNNGETKRQRLALTDADNGVYTGFIYCADPNGWGNKFKFQKESGNWDSQLNADNFTTFTDDIIDAGDGDRNFSVNGGESVYFFTVNLGSGEISAVEVVTMGLIGDFNSWSGDVELTWNAEKFCFEGDLSQVTDKGWKFRVNCDWAINLGGKSLNNLVADGKNLEVTGSTVQLYPTRRTNDNIFATIDGQAAEDPEPGIDPSTLTPFIYYIGATDGWTAAEQKLALTDAENGVYTGFLYCADPNGWGNQFKFQKEPGNWDSQINAYDLTNFSGDAVDPGNGGNIGVTGGENVYYVKVDLAKGEIYAEEVLTMGIIGDFNGWAGDLEMAWNASEYCYDANISEITAGSWKFRINGDWKVNLGGTADDLSSDGDNLSITGSTCKLYPTRRDNDKIHCIVE